jgi:hypothetical protein
MKVGAIPAYRLNPKGGTSPDRAYAGEAWITSHSATRPETPMGEAQIVAYRGAALDIGWEVSESATVMVNQNGADGWRCEDHAISATAKTKWGLLGFDVPAGRGTTTCRWRPPRMVAGLATSTLGLILLLVLWPWVSGGRRRH